LAQVGTFYTQHIKGKVEARRNAGKRRIRIAVLDTGIDEKDLYISPILDDIKAARRKQHLAQRRAERSEGNPSKRRHPATSPEFSPIRMKRSFVIANGIAGDTLDSCGHGTHTTGLLLTIAPEADIYVAKIACDVKFENIDPIAKVS
jgi:hypothetical protein